jgi:hypothetical protein
MLDCKHASRLVSQSMDRKLSLRERLGLQLHLLMCDACSQFSRQISLLRQAVRQWSMRIENDNAINLSDEARNRIRHSIQQSDQNF